MSSPRTIVHLDMDAFFASVELLRHPELRGQPVVVGGEGRRGVVAAASYEARYYGVHSAMSSVRARQLCPHAVFLHGDHAHYREISAQVMAILKTVTPLVEPLSLDEAFLDVTAAQRLFGSGREIAAHLRAEIIAATGLTCSAGVATNKFIAKLATEQAKPKVSKSGPVLGIGVHVVEPGAELAFLHPLPARALWGVGPSTMKRLARIGVATVADLAALPLATVTAAVGKAHGRHLHNLAHARDDRAVESHHQPKSISHEETFEFDRRDPEVLNRDVLRMSDAVASRLRTSELVARTVGIKVRFGDFETISRVQTLDAPTNSAHRISGVARELLAAIDVGRGVRLLGVTSSGLGQPQAQQLSFDDLVDGGSVDRRRAEKAVEDIRRRFGQKAIGPAALVDRVSGLTTRDRSEKPWG